MALSGDTNRDDVCAVSASTEKTGKHAAVGSIIYHSPFRKKNDLAHHSDLLGPQILPETSPQKFPNIINLDDYVCLLPIFIFSIKIYNNPKTP